MPRHKPENFGSAQAANRTTSRFNHEIVHLCFSSKPHIYLHLVAVFSVLIIFSICCGITKRWNRTVIKKSINEYLKFILFSVSFLTLAANELQNTQMNRVFCSSSSIMQMLVFCFALLLFALRCYNGNYFLFIKEYVSAVSLLLKKKTFKNSVLLKAKNLMYFSIMKFTFCSRCLFIFFFLSFCYKSHVESTRGNWNVTKQKRWFFLITNTQYHLEDTRVSLSMLVYVFYICFI